MRRDNKDVIRALWQICGFAVPAAISRSGVTPRVCSMRRRWWWWRAVHYARSLSPTLQRHSENLSHRFAMTFQSDNKQVLYNFPCTGLFPLFVFFLSFFLFLYVVCRIDAYCKMCCISLLI